jgi:hypothetical protein
MHKILNKYINVNNQLTDLKYKKNYTGNIKYFPAITKEWNNNVYYYNNNIKNLPLYTNVINVLIKSFFSSYRFFKVYTEQFYENKKFFSLRRIHISDVKIKHTNNKIIISLYTFNKEKLVLLRKIKKLQKKFIGKISHLLYKYKKFSYNKNFLILLYKELMLIKKYKNKLVINLYKFEEFLLSKLNTLIGKIFLKKIEFNIINLKSLVFNTDIFTRIATIKLKSKKRKINPLKIINIFFNKAKLPKVNRIKEKGRINKQVDKNLLDNRFKNLNLNYILKNKFKNLDEILFSLYNNNVYKTIFDLIKHKNLGGIRLEAKGRLTKRYRADRALYKVKWKGGLKDIDSSYKGLSSVIIKGYSNSNLDYSISKSKRRIGAFAIKGWISGK